jgi:endonuclease/exonuclease/phosphatase (EEP) superfamily protein YafD
MLRILTANLFNGRAHPVEFGRLLDDVKPDVLAVQELAPNVAAEIARRFPFRDLDARLDHLGLGIGSRVPATFGVVPMMYRPARFAMIHDAGEGLDLVNLHLLNPLQWPWRASVRGRTEQISAVEEFMASRRAGPRLVVGDMNASPAWPAYRRLVGSLDDLAAAAAFRNGSRACRTWAYRDGLPRLLRIDHVFGHGVEPVRTEVRRVVGSDHAALVVDLEVASPG